MLSLITTSNYFINSTHSFPHLISSISLKTHFKKRPRNQPGVVLGLKKNSLFGFRELRRVSGSGSWCFCCKGLESEGDLVLEGEILEFMKKSKKPNEFPTKKELVEGGRIDLVDAIVKKGGWLSLGWESDNDDDENEGEDINFDIRDFQTRLESFQQSNNSLEGEPEGSHNSSQLASPSPSGRSLEMVAEEDTGIEGILNRLEKHRTLSFGINLEENGCGTYASSKEDRSHTYFGTSTAASKPDKQTTWSVQRGGFSDVEFKASKISFGKKGKEGHEENSKDKLLAITQGDSELLDRYREINLNQIKSRLQHLELELSSALHSLLSKNEKLISKDHESTPSDLQQLSDVWEFQENEVMNAQDKLRSIQAKLAVFEGKMTLAIIDAQKIVEAKQKRIDSAHKALQLLRTACVVWPNSASEVFLAGSFDGWTTQRKMEKSRTCIFSVSLKLYPGRYEIKFIVDGIWRIDPLRPIVHNNGHENNILIIT